MLSNSMPDCLHSMVGSSLIEVYLSTLRHSTHSNTPCNSSSCSSSRQLLFYSLAPI